MQVPRLRRASAARSFQQRVRCEEVAVSGAALRIVSQRARRRPRRVDSAVVEQPFADRKVGRDGDGEPVQLRLRADPRAKENCGREVRPGREHDDGGLVDVTLVVDDADRAAVSQDDPVDEGVRSHGQVRARPAGIEVGERRVPAHPFDDVRRKGSGADGCAQVVQVVETREPERLRSLDESQVERARPIRVRGRRSERRPCALEIRAEALVRPARTPLVVVGGRSLDDHACVHGRRAAEHLSAERSAVSGSRFPEVRGRDPSVRRGSRVASRQRSAARSPARPRAGRRAGRRSRSVAKRGRTLLCRHPRRGRRSARAEDTARAVPWPG